MVAPPSKAARRRDARRRGTGRIDSGSSFNFFAAAVNECETDFFGGLPHQESGRYSNKDDRGLQNRTRSIESGAENWEEPVVVEKGDVVNGRAALGKEIEADEKKVMELKKKAQDQKSQVDALKKQLEKKEAALIIMQEELQFAEQEVERKQEVHNMLEDDVEQEKLEQLEAEKKRVETLLQAHKKQMSMKRHKATSESSDDSLVEVDVVLSSSSIASLNVTCPISLQTMIDPVRNKVCGHIYSKTAIEKFLDNHSRIVCPIAACQNKNMDKSQLQDDMATKVLIEHACRRQASKQAHTIIEVLDIDEQK